MNRRPIPAFALAAGLASCTAVGVLTHTTDSDPVAAPAGRYALDPHHWSLVFDLDHLGYSRFVMRFDRVSATLDFVPLAPETSRLAVVIDAASIDTNDPDLDRMVKGPDMLDAAHYPEIRFDGTGIRRTGKDSGEVTGDLQVRGRSLPVVLAVRFNGGAPDPLVGNAYTLGFAATAAFDRAQLGLPAWFPAVGTGIDVSIQAEFVKAGG